MTTLYPSIIFLQSDENYTLIFLEDGSKRVSARTLKRFEESLDAKRFIRPHKSYIINLDYFESLDESDCIHLTNGVTIKIARRRKEAIEKIIHKLPRKTSPPKALSKKHLSKIS